MEELCYRRWHKIPRIIYFQWFSLSWTRNMIPHMICFDNMRSFVDDTDELCIISDGHPCIQKMVSRIYPASQYGCCMRYLRENIKNNFHNSKVVSHFNKEERRTIYVSSMTISIK